MTRLLLILATVALLCSPVTAQICGDCDLDGFVNILDSYYVATVAVGLAPAPPHCSPEFISCNVVGLCCPDPAAVWSILDAYCGARFVVGLITLACC